MGELEKELHGDQQDFPAPLMPERILTRQRHIKETRAELLAMGESDETVQQWLKPHIDALQSEIEA